MFSRRGSTLITQAGDVPLQTNRSVGLYKRDFEWTSNATGLRE
jgi:hypothetical protein